jgi:hypothetical protein
MLGGVCFRGATVTRSARTAGPSAAVFTNLLSKLGRECYAIGLGRFFKLHRGRVETSLDPAA